MAAGVLVGLVAGAVTPAAVRRFDGSVVVRRFDGPVVARRFDGPVVARRFDRPVVAGSVAGSAVAGCSGRAGRAAGGFGWRERWWIWALVGGAAGAALGWRLDATGWVSAGWLVMLAVGIPLAGIDLGVYRLPDALVLPAAVLVAGLAAVAGSLSALLGGAALATGFALLAVLPRSGLGFGDVKLAGPLGTALALLGWWPLVLGTVYAFVLGAAAAVVLLATGRATRGTHIPFGPAMLAGAWLAAIT